MAKIIDDDGHTDVSIKEQGEQGEEGKDRVSVKRSGDSIAIKDGTTPKTAADDGEAAQQSNKAGWHPLAVLAAAVAAIKVGKAVLGSSSPARKKQNSARKEQDSDFV